VSDSASAAIPAATAADAAVLRLAEDASLKSPGALVRHPSAALYGDVFATVLPAIATIAARKNVPRWPTVMLIR
jgi:hypothetical protein